MKKKKVLLISLGRKGDTSYNMFSSLGDFMSERYECRILLINTSGPWDVLRDNFSHLKHILWADIVLAHATSAPAIALLCAARLLRRKVIIFQWDIYPTTIAGVRRKNKLIHRLLYKAEDICLALADRIVVPSDDFAEYSKAWKTVILPLWPPTNASLHPFERRALGDGPVHIAFAGQINETRGLVECIAHFAIHSPTPIVLHLFSGNRLPPDFGGAAHSTIQIEEHGVLPREELQARLTQMHFGLVSLNPRMDQPGFPSKTFDYLQSGLPILYFGRLLPGYTSDIEKFGIGIDITKEEYIDLRVIYDDISSIYDEGREEYLVHTSLKWSSLANIC